MVITSVDNAHIKYIKKLKGKKYRMQYREFLVETPHLLEEAYKAALLKELIVIEGTNISCDVPVTYVSKTVMKQLSSLEESRCAIGVCRMKEDCLTGNRLLILDRIQDPGNLGTMIRSACAFGIQSILVSQDTVDSYNDKVIRASQGMRFHINILEGDLESHILSFKKQGYLILGTSVDHGKNIRAISALKKCALIIGNEGQGIREELLPLCDTFVYIPMVPTCESLNASVAASILLYELFEEK